MKCDICMYDDDSKLGTVVQECLDGIRRCKVCRHLLMYGRYISSDAEEFELYRTEEFTEEYREMIKNAGEID